MQLVKPLMPSARPILFHPSLVFLFHEALLKFSKTTITLKMEFPSKYLTENSYGTLGTDQVSLAFGYPFVFTALEKSSRCQSDWSLSMSAGMGTKCSATDSEWRLPNPVRSINFIRARGMNHFSGSFNKKWVQNESGSSLTEDLLDSHKKVLSTWLNFGQNFYFLKNRKGTSTLSWFSIFGQYFWPYLLVKALQSTLCMRLKREALFCKRSVTRSSAFF